jgi:Skp family chaperone for outer membrane proteins
VLNPRWNSETVLAVTKRIAWLGSALACGALFYLVVAVLTNANSARGSAAPAAAAKPQTRIAFVNLAYVLKNYKKVDALAGDFKTRYKDYEKEAQTKKSEMDALDAENNDPKTDVTKREENLQKMVQLKRDIEEINQKARKALAPQSEANTVEVYQDIQNAVKRYAEAHNFEMVLQFQDGFTEEDLKSPMNIMNKMQTRACIPIYLPKANDISSDVTSELNEALEKK